MRAHRDGIVTSATVMVTGRNAAAAVLTAQEQGLGLGLHLALAGGLTPAAPAQEVPNLAPGGKLRASWAVFVRDFWLGRVPQAEVKRELWAQWQACEALGFHPDHLDSHQHLHLLPGIAELVEELALENDLPVRWPSESWPSTWLESPGAAAKSLILSGLGKAREVFGDSRLQRVRAKGIYEAGRLNDDRLLSLLEGLEAGDHEIGCHPGLEPDVVAEDETWTYGWEVELAALTHPKVRKCIERRGIELCGYSALV